MSYRTPGPWIANSDGVVTTIGGANQIAVCPAGTFKSAEEAQANAEFIAQAGSETAVSKGAPKTGPFFGYVVWNQNRGTVVVDHDTDAMVWDTDSEAAGHVRDNVLGDEVRRVQLKFL